MSTIAKVERWVEDAFEFVLVDHFLLCIAPLVVVAVALVAVAAIGTVVVLFRVIPF